MVDADDAGRGAKSDDTITDLDAAVVAAVAEGLGVVDRLSEKVLEVLGGCQAAADDAASDHGALPGGEVIAAYAELIKGRRAEAQRRFFRQRTRLSTFNLVLFGRTGAGKSSLIEALSSGDGEPISRGESDWTTDVRDVYWRSTRLVDTPGTGGWGRTTSLADLEARAEAAVADADVVILCFDTQSQQAGEFSKIAQWVSRYGKPVVAVLNSRNARWRHPIRVGSQSTRRDLSRTIHEHAGNIDDELGQIDLPDVPIVAIHTKRAAFARTRDPFTGPDADSRQKQRNEYGPERLLAWSNLPALELLISEALARHATPLRLGMLHEQARGLLTEAQAAAQAQHDEASVLAEQLERGITDVLGLVGRPADEGLGKSISRLEKLRGGFGTIGTGELRSHARYRLADALQIARAEAFRDADRLIEDAFDAKGELSPEEFERLVLIPARKKAEAAARAVGAELQRYLAQRLELVADDVRADLRAAIQSFAGAETTAGRSGRSLGVALETGSALLGIGSSGVILAAALVNSWNPAGWVLGAVAAVSFVGGIATAYLGGRLRKKATRDRIGALSTARARGRRAVHDSFEHLEQAISEDFSRILSQAAHERLASDVANATALRRVCRAGATAVRDIQKALDDLPEAADARHLLSEVARDLQRRHFPGESTAQRLLWLGESWVADPEGLTETEPEAPTAHQDHDPVDYEPLRARIRSVIAGLNRAPQAGAGAAWAAATMDELTGDEYALDAITSVQELVDGAPPRIVLAGDYSTGKSSFVKRLLVDSDLAVPDRLDVAAQPTTGSAEVFRWGDWEIVDTPGFQSTTREHAAVAHEAVVGASLVIVLFNPNLLVGGATDLLAVLVGDRAAGRVGKLARTLFVINRSDELGIDPREDPVGFRNLCRRKELELARALGALHGEGNAGLAAVNAEQILCVASDPYGMVGDRDELTRADYDQHRDWDGMDALRHGLADASAALDHSGVDVRILEGGSVILADVVEVQRQRLAALSATIGQRRLLLLDLDACLSAGRALQASARDRLATTYVAYVAALFDEVSSTTHDDGMQAARAEQLSDWADSPEVEQLFHEWSSRFARDQEEWQEATSARVEARLTSAAFTSAFDAGDTALDVDHLQPDAEPKVRGKAVEGAKSLARGAANASREGVTKAAHALGHKFRPWGATKLTAKINKAGGALGIALGAVELYGIYRSVRREGDEERSAGERRAVGLRQVRDAAEAFFDSTDSDAPGRSMAEAIDQVQRIRDEEAVQLDAEEAEAATLARRIAVCERRMRDAIERLERPTP